MQTKFNQKHTEFSSRISELFKHRPILCTLSDEESKTVIPCEYLSPLLDIANHELCPNNGFYETSDSIGYKDKSSNLEIKTYQYFKNTDRLAECMIVSSFESKGSCSFCLVGDNELIVSLEENGTNIEGSITFS